MSSLCDMPPLVLEDIALSAGSLALAAVCRGTRQAAAGLRAQPDKAARLLQQLLRPLDPFAAAFRLFHHAPPAFLTALPAPAAHAIVRRLRETVASAPPEAVFDSFYDLLTGAIARPDAANDALLVELMSTSKSVEAYRDVLICKCLEAAVESGRLGTLRALLGWFDQQMDLPPLVDADLLGLAAEAQQWDMVTCLAATASVQFHILNDDGEALATVAHLPPQALDRTATALATQPAKFLTLRGFDELRRAVLRALRHDPTAQARLMGAFNFMFGVQT